MLTSIIIPTYQHAGRLPDAIASALAQTAPVEVIVVDDGSTDGTAAMVRKRFPSVRLFEQKHAGPSAARNVGIESATGDLVMFLDADDTIEPHKVATQIAHLTPDVGFVLCDVRVEQNGTAQLASQRYNYLGKDIGGWIAPLLAAANFIPNMSPLIRRSVLGSIRFHLTREPEDWHFIHSIAQAGRCRYVPQVLATYRKQLHGRNHSRKRAPWLRPGVVEPTRLNLGCGTQGTRSWHPMPGLVNLDRSLGWKFEDGLGDFIDGTVAGISVSHAAMYVALADWPAMLSEFARVLAPGGVLRITEDDTEHPGSRTYGVGWKGSEPAVTLTGPKMARQLMEFAGFSVHDVTRDATHYVDRSLIQAQHGDPPSVFFIEGVRENVVLFEPHSDDGALFSSYNAIRYRPRVVTCFPSSGDYGDTDERARETQEAMTILGAGPCEQWDGTELWAKMYELDERLRPTIVFAPAAQASHREHVWTGLAAAGVFGKRVRFYHTYDEDGKVREGSMVDAAPGWLELKRLALLRYQTQLKHERARVFFEWPYEEFIE